MENNIYRASKIIAELRSMLRELEDFKKKNSSRAKAIDKFISLKNAEIDLQEKIIDFYRNRASIKSKINGLK